MFSRTRVVTGLVLAGLVGVLARPAQAAPAGPSAQAELRPNLKTMTPYDLRLAEVDGERVLRLSNEIGNAGVGPLELYPVAEDCDGDGRFADDRTAYQRIYLDANEDGVFTRGTDTESVSRAAGCFKFHRLHNHWHLGGFSRYSLHRLSDGLRVATSGKISFCVVDSYRRFAIPGSPTSSYYNWTGCDADGTQGLSIGWSDLYRWDLPDQWIVVESVPAGDYCLMSKADPGKRLDETDDRDNLARVPIHLTATTVTVLSGSC